MRRDQLAHILRAASTIAGDRDVLVLGSQAILIAVLPARWQDRIVTYDAEGADGARAHCLDPHDLVVSKLVAHRMKDLEFADALLAAGLLDPDVLIARARDLEAPSHVSLVTGWVLGWVGKHGSG